MTIKKRKLIFFVDVVKLPPTAQQAKLMQLRDYMNKENPFGDDYDVIIVACDENKLALAESERDVQEEFVKLRSDPEKGREDYEKFVLELKEKSQDCLTILLEP